MNHTSSNSIDREQLLRALDAEIGYLQSARTSIGYSRWALTLSFAALFWLGLEIWGKSKVSIKSVVAVAIALTVIWEFLQKIFTSLDSNLNLGTAAGRRYYDFWTLLGALRSTIIFNAIRAFLILTGMFWLSEPSMAIAKWLMLGEFMLITLVFIFTYAYLPPMPMSEENHPFRNGIRLSRWGDWIARTILAVSGFFLLKRFWLIVSPDEFRLSLLSAVLLILLTLIVEDRFPRKHLLALQAVRQDLAFMRITIEQAKDHTDLLLLAGRAPGDFTRRSAEAIFEKVAEVQSLYAEVEALLPRFSKLQTEFQGNSNEGSDPARDEFDRFSKIVESSFATAKRRHKRLLAETKKLQGQANLMGLFSASVRQELAPLLQKVGAAIGGLHIQELKITTSINPSEQVAVVERVGIGHPEAGSSKSV